MEDTGWFIEWARSLQERRGEVVQAAVRVGDRKERRAEVERSETHWVCVWRKAQTLKYLEQTDTC